MKGSSPLARGLHRMGLVVDEGPVDHPRSRGVYQVDGSPRKAKMGSSPLARGLLTSEDREIFIDRIIPARAGFT